MVVLCVQALTSSCREQSILACRLLLPVTLMMFDIQMKRVNGDDACIMLRKAGVTLPLLAMSGTVGYLSYGPIEKYVMFSVTSVCTRRTGAASQAFERMHNTRSHRSKT